VPKAVAKNAATRVTLKVVLAALEALPDESPEGARRFVIQNCRNGNIRWGTREPADPPANSFQGDLANFSFSGSDVRNRAVVVIMPDGLPDVVAVTLWGVWLIWEDIARLRPELGATPPPAVKAVAPMPVTIVGDVKVRIKDTTVRIKTFLARAMKRSPKVGSAAWWLDQLGEEACRGRTGKELQRMAEAEAGKRSEPLSIPGPHMFQTVMKERGW
jgi:hypothetical protein